MSVTIRRVVICGRVQGVGYRAWAEYTALEVGLEGWVRNRRDGTVEELFAGPADEVAAMVAYLAGPEARFTTGASLTIEPQAADGFVVQQR